MKQSLTKRELITVGFMFFALFLGAGNIIFAPFLGQTAGENTWIAISGFLITGVGLTFLSILALSISGGKSENIANHVHPLFGFLFTIALYLILGPIFAIPRTAAVIHEIVVVPNLSTGLENSALLISSTVLLIISLFLSLNPSKLVDRFGKVLVPVLLVVLVSLITKSIITPMGEIGEAQNGYEFHPFSMGFLEGYNTMDVLAAFIFAPILLSSLKNLGITEAKWATKISIKAGIIASLGLAFVHISLSYIGASSLQAIGVSGNGGEILAQSARYLYGGLGSLLLGIIILCAGLTTAIGLIVTSAEYFNRINPKISYKAYVIIITFVSLLITNLGLEQIISISTPVLVMLYPLAISLVVLRLTHKVFNGYRPVYIGGVTGAGILGVVYALKEIGIGAEVFDSIFGFLPFYSQGLGWAVPMLFGGVTGYIFAIIKSSPEYSGYEQVLDSQSKEVI
ncbi:branched-chain amino acid transport system II carrier protein [Peribacillus butanolivorans]|uniref:branched-chain amino acid transport system II carrier protein n=1 Tax=Peribacillus butanolivorans TaxID=421767 RepID=UPI0036DC02EF